MAARILRRLYRIGVALVAVAALLGVIDLGTRFTNLTADVEGRQRPFMADGGMGQPVHARTFIATALAMRGAAVIHDSSTFSSADHKTNGVWLIVKVEITAIDQPRFVGYAAIRDAKGRVYLASPRLNQPITGGRTLQPGLPVIGEIAFEMPRDAAASPTLLLAKGSYQDMDSVVEISLGTNSPATVAGWAGDQQPVTLMETTVKA